MVLFEVLLITIPTIELLVVVPVPPAAVIFLIVLPVNVPIGLVFKIPLTIVPVAVEVLLIELATVPPIVLLLHVHVTLEPVLLRIP